MLDVVIGRAAPFIRVENNAIVIRVPSHVILLCNGCYKNLLDSCGMLQVHDYMYNVYSYTVLTA